MKLIQIIQEGALDRLLGGNLRGVNANNQSEGAATEIKELLQNHTLVLGLQPDGRFRTGARAWTGPIDDEWTPALNNAITAWKRSINMQLGATPPGDRGELDTAGTPSITEDDIEYLRARLGSNGLLLAPRGRVQTAPADGNIATVFNDKTYTGRLNVTDETQVENNGRSFLSAIGFSGWFIILRAIAQEQGLEVGVDATTGNVNNAFGNFMRNKFNILEQDIGQPDPSAWVTSFRTLILRNESNFAIQTNSGRKVLNPPLSLITGGTEAWVNLYLHFADIATALFNDDQQATAERREETRPDALTLNGRDDITAVVTAIERAIENSAWGLITRGGTDEETLKTILTTRIRTLADWNAVEEAWRTTNGEDLGERLYNELKDERADYEGIVLRTLVSVGRVNPLLMHASINFGEATELVVTVDGTEYRVQKRLNEGRPDIRGYTEDEFNALIIDRILREAITQSGNQIPDTNLRLTEDQQRRAGAVFTVAIQESFPEMVAWYTYQEPFSTFNVPNIGRVRMGAIVQQIGRLITASNSLSSAIQFAQEQIEEDRVFLIGDGDTEGEANIYFDPLYRPEGFGRDRFLGDVPDDDVELNDEERDISERLMSTNEAERNAAIDEILNDSDPQSTWMNIYKDSAREGKFLDKEPLGTKDNLLDIIEGRGGDSNVPMTRVISALGAAIASPRLVAELFDDAVSGIGTKTDLAQALINIIQNRSEYNFINTRYKQISGGEELINDIAGEEFFGLIGGSLYNSLAARIGEEGIALAEAGVPTAVRDAIDDVRRSPTVDNLQDLISELQSIRNLNSDQAEAILDSMNEIKSSFDLEDATDEGILINSIITALEQIENDDSVRFRDAFQNTPAAEVADN